MISDRFLLYQNVLKHAASLVPVTVPIAGNPTLYMMVEAEFRGLYLLGAFGDDCGPLIGAFDTIHVGKVNHWGKELLKVGTDSAEHFQQVLALLCDIADLVQVERRPLAEAVTEATSRWRALLAPSLVMSATAERGLLGELWLLDRIIADRGSRGLDAWQGPEGELHDFSIGSRAFEVKATLSRERIHTISDLRQLQPSFGTDLYVVSLQLQPDGGPAAATLPRAVDVIRDLLRADAGRLSRFSELLRKVGYDDRHRDRYTTRYKLRTNPALIKIDDSVPALTPLALERAFGQQALDRIFDVKYSISFERLGHEDGSPEFLEVLPPAESNVLP